MIPWKYLAPRSQSLWVALFLRRKVQGSSDAEVRPLRKPAKAASSEQWHMPPEIRTEAPRIFCSEDWDRFSDQLPQFSSEGEQCQGSPMPNYSFCSLPTSPLSTKPSGSSTEITSQHVKYYSILPFTGFCDLLSQVSPSLCEWSFCWHWFRSPSEYQGFLSTIYRVFSLPNLLLKELTCLYSHAVPARLRWLTHFRKPPQVQNGCSISI